MGQPMGLNGVKALVVEHGLDQPARRRIPVGGRHEVRAKVLADRRHVLECIHIGLTNEAARQRRVVEPFRQPIDDRRFKRVVMQNRRIDEGCELRLAPDRFLSLAADARPYWIDCVDYRLRLILRHATASRGAATNTTPSTTRLVLKAPKPRSSDMGLRHSSMAG